MKRYKEDQGRLARMAAFWGVTLLLLFGCNFLYETMLDGSKVLSTPVQGIRIPVIAVDLSPAFIICMAIFLVGVFVIHRWQQRPRVADLLIDTEAELRKVTWPNSQEVVNAALIVIISVILIGVFLALVDMFLARIMKTLILGGA